MLISCNCLNFHANYRELKPIGNANNNNNNNNSNSSSSVSAAETSALTATLSQLFMRKHPRDFVYFNSFMDFFAHAYGPITDLTVNAINQRDLIYSLTLDGADQSWQLYICINCKVVLCAKRSMVGAGATPTHYLINRQQICTSEELALRRSHKSYSEAFGVLIMDQDDAAPGNGTTSSPTGIVNSASSLSIGSLSSQAPPDGNMQRVRNLAQHQKAHLKAEYKATTERIDRYTEQSFALLKSSREKCNQEGAVLARLIQQLPEQASELLDRAMPVALEVTGSSINYAAGPGTRRRNTISSRRELGVPTTPTTPQQQPPNFLGLTQITPEPQPQPQLQQQQQQQQQQPSQLVSAYILTARKMSNIDTPPATPEAMPMSVGNSPTFRQQQQQQQQPQTSAVAMNNKSLLISATATNAAGTDDADDCLFDLEDVDGPMQVSSIYQHPQQQQQHYQRLQQQQQQLHQQNQDNMSDADEAEDALDLDSSLPIPMRGGGGTGSRSTAAQMHFANFARSLPVEIANSPMAMRMASNNNNNHQHVLLEDDEVLDNNVDIAASIKALAKSVHGEAVFGDLPRPRLRSQI